MIARGRNINVTLIFSLERHMEVADAYIRGLERLVESAATRRRWAPSPATSSRVSTPRPTAGSTRPATRS